MISPINSSMNSQVYYDKKISFKKNQETFSEYIFRSIKKRVNNFSFSDLLNNLVIKIAKSENNSDNNINEHLLLKSIAKLFNRKLYFDKYGKLIKSENYKNDKLKTVKYFKSGKLIPYSIDEYRDGIIFKNTTFYDSSFKKRLVSEYDPLGNNRIYEYYPNGRVKTFQVEKNDKIQNISYFDEFGFRYKGEKYNDDDETIASAVIYEKDKYIQELYNHGVLVSKLITFFKDDIKKNIFFDENNKIKSILESGKNYNIFYHYSDNKLDWSETKYSNKDILYKKTEYDKFEKPKIEYLYDKNRILSFKNEITDNKIIKTKYNIDGNIAYIEVIDSKTKKIIKRNYYSK